MPFFSRNRDKTATEAFALAFTPAWAATVAWVMFSGVFARWGEWQHMALGVGVALPLWLLPFFVERERRLIERHSFRWVALLTLFSFIQNYFGAQLFFRLFGMQYHFHVRVVVAGTPLFLYFMTVAYFATYYAVMQVAWRWVCTRTKSWLARTLARAALGYAMAFAETASMANPSLAGYFSYDSPRFVMVWGSIIYGSIFFVTLPLFARLDEEPDGERPPLRRAVWDLLALNMICLVLYEVLEVIARRFLP